MLTLNAIAISDAILLPDEIMMGQIKSIHNDYVNILTPRGMITLVRSGMVHIPFGIEVELNGGWLDTELRQNQPVLYSGDGIIFDEIMAITGLRNCRRFSCKPSYVPLVGGVDFLSRLRCLQLFCDHTNRFDGIMTYLGQYDTEQFCLSKTNSILFETRIAQLVKTLIIGIVQNNEYLITEGVCGLLGAGSGSTPSGDDFLLGFLSGLVHVQPEYPASEKMAYHMVQNASHLTTNLSIAYIKYGVKGLYHQRFGEMISAFITGTEEDMMSRVQELMTLGHSSGIDLLVGFVYGGFTALSAV